MTRPWPSADPRLRPPATPWLRSSATSVASCLSGDDSREPRQVLGPRTLVDDEDMARHAGLRQRRADRRHGLLGAIERQDHHIGIVLAVAVGRRHRQCDALSLRRCQSPGSTGRPAASAPAVRAPPVPARGRRRTTATRPAPVRSPAVPWAAAAPCRCAGTAARPAGRGRDRRSAAPRPVSPNDCSGRSCFTSIMMVRRMRSPSEMVCSLERDPAARPRYCVASSPIGILQFERVDGEFGLGLEAGGERRERLDEAPAEHAIAGQHVADAVAEHAAHQDSSAHGCRCGGRADRPPARLAGGPR